MTTQAKQESTTPIQKSATPIQTRPTNGLTAFDEMERMFDEFMSRGWLRPFSIERPRWSEMTLPFEGRSPKIDVIERDNEIAVIAELPGVNKEDLDVSVTDNSITIKGSTRSETKEEKGDYYRKEISSGSYARTMTLPTDIDGSKAKSTFKNGVLELTLPKVKKSNRHTIKVQ